MPVSLEPPTSGALESVQSALFGSEHLEEMLGLVLRETLDYCAIEAGAIYLVEPGGNGIRLAVYHGAAREEAEKFKKRPWNECYSSRILDRDAPFVVDDLTQDHVLESLPGHPLHGSGYRSLAAQPLRAGRELTGVAFLVSREPGRVSPKAAGLLAAVAAPLALAIKHSLLKVELAATHAERQRLRSRLLQAQKLELIGRLRGGLIHDLNNLLTVVQSFATLGLEELDCRGPVRDTFDEILRASIRAGDLTRQVLAFSRIEPQEERMVDAGDIVLGAVRMLERLVGPEVDLRVQGAGDSFPVRIAPGQLELVLANLVINARDAMPQGGRLTIGLDRRTLAPGEAIGMPEARSGDHVVLSVRDSGAGMLPEIQAMMFEPFFTTKSAGCGTGLGLPTVMDIVTRADGFIQVDSTPGHGTELRIFLPRVAMAARQVGTVDADARLRPRDPEQGRGRLILVVEDNDAVRKVAEAVLVRCGYRVLAASDGQAALDLALSCTERIDLVLTDVRMPRMGGPTLVRRLRETTPGVRAAFMTGQSDLDLACDDGLPVEGPEGGEVVLHKPFDMGSLLDAVEKAFGMEEPEP